MSVFGCDVYEKYPQLFKRAQHVNQYKDSKSEKRLTVFVEALFSMKKYLKRIVRISERLKRQFSKESLEKLTNSSDVYDLIKKGFEETDNATFCHMVASNNSIIYQLLAFTFLVGKSETLTPNHLCDIATILGSISDIESANIPEMIQETAGQISVSKKREEFLKVDNSQAVEWMKQNCRDAFVIFEAFMARHGHRSLNELDIIAKPWEIQPEKVIDMIKSNLKVSVSDFVKIKQKAPTAGEILSKLKNPLGKISTLVLRFILPKCQRGVQNREFAKSHLVKIVNEVRRGVNYLGTLMVHEGLLPDKELIFYLSFSEIKDVITTRDAKVVSKSIRRQKLFEKLNEMKFPEISFGIPRPITSDPAEENLNIVQGDILVRGVSVCSGIVTADACVCKSFADVSKLKKGDILVTYGTDIAWSPYFPILGGICTEIGKKCELNYLI